MLGLCDPVNILALCRAKHSSVLKQTLRMDCLNVFGQSISRWSQVPGHICSVSRPIYYATVGQQR